MAVSQNAKHTRHGAWQFFVSGRGVSWTLLIGALASGALYAFANVGYGLWYLAFVCFVPVIVQLEKQRAAVLVAAKAGFFLGIMLYLVGYPWLLALADGFVSPRYSLPMWLAYGAVFALNFSALFGVFRALRLLGVHVLLAFPFALLVLESLQLNLFPFYLGASLIHAPVLAQAADIGGVYLLTCIVALVNACVASLLVPSDSTSGFMSDARVSSQALRSVLLGIVISAALYFYGLFALALERDKSAELQASASLRVGMVQTQLKDTSDPVQRIHNHQHYVDLSHALLDQVNVDLLIWPEAAYGMGVRGALPLDGRLIAKDIDVPILFGSSRLRPYQGQDRSENSVLLLDRQGVIGSSYSKQVLIPFSEYIPFGEQLRSMETSVSDSVSSTFTRWIGSALYTVFPKHQDFRAGVDGSGVTFEKKRIATPICYESVMPDLVRTMVNEEQAQLLVSVANDSWFGRSQEPKIHLAMARLRAIEHRRWFVRVTNGGISASIAPDGRVTNSIALGTEGTSNSLVQWRSESTLYTVYGNWISVLLFLLVVLNLVLNLVSAKLTAKTPKYDENAQQAV